VGEGVLSFVGDAVGIGKVGGGVDVEFGVGVHPVADPSHLHAADLGDPGFGGQCGFGRIDKSGVHPVHEAAEDVAHCTAQDSHNRHGHQQSDDGVGQGEAQGRAPSQREPMATRYGLLCAKYLQYERIALNGPVITVDVTHCPSW